MLEEPVVVQSEPAKDSTTHVVHALMHFLMAVRYRKNVMITSVLAALLLAVFYFLTATPYYSATAQVWTDKNGVSASFSKQGGPQRHQMPTFEQLFVSTEVIAGALDLIPPEDRVDLGEAPRHAWPAILKPNVHAQVVRGTHIIEVSFRSKDPRAAVSVVNALVQSYEAFLDRTYKGTAGDAIRVLEDKLRTLEQSIATTQQRLAEMRRTSRDIGTGGEGTSLHPLQQKAVSLSEALTKAQQRQADLATQMLAIEGAVRAGRNLQPYVLKVAEVVGKEMLMNSLGVDDDDAYIVANIEQQIVNAQADLASLQKNFGPAHPEIIDAQNKILTSQRYLKQRRQQLANQWVEIHQLQLGPMLLSIVGSQLEGARQDERQYKSLVDQAMAEAVAVHGELTQLRQIQRKLERDQSLQDKLFENIADIGLRHKGQEVTTEVVQRPVEASRPFSPNLRRTLMMAVVAGVAAGLALVYVFDILDDRFRSVEEMQGQLSVPVLAMVGQLEAADAEGAESLQMSTAPNAPECEAFRTLRTALALTDGETRQIVISSAEPGDGKTTVLANLAVSYAQSNKRTLLIDADLRRPGLTALMGMRGIDGLSSVVRGQDNVVQMATEHIRSSGVEGLDVLASGPRPANPAELLADPRFSELLAWAQTVYDQILVDSPPALATSDTAVIGRLVDGVVMVVQPDKNRRRMVLRAAESLAGLKIPLLGLIVNRVGAEGNRGYYGYGGGYGYGYGYAPAYGPNEEELGEESMNTLHVGDTSAADRAAADRAA